MAATFQQTDAVAGGGVDDALCSGNSNNTGDSDSNQAEVGGSAGSTENTVTLDASASDLNAVWMELDNIDSYDGASGTWTVQFVVTAGNHQGSLEEIHLCRVNSSYVNQETLGSTVAIGDNLGTAQTYSNDVTQGSSTTISAGDKVIVVLAFSNGNSCTQDLGYTPSGTITSPWSLPALASIADWHPATNEPVMQRTVVQPY